MDALRGIACSGLLIPSSDPLEEMLHTITNKVTAKNGYTQPKVSLPLVAIKLKRESNVLSIGYSKNRIISLGSFCYWRHLILHTLLQNLS